MRAHDRKDNNTSNNKTALISGLNISEEEKESSWKDFWPRKLLAMTE